MIDRQHYYIKEITSLRKNMEKTKKLSHNHETPKSRDIEETEKKKFK
jgi:hypothetical protein